MHICVCIYIYIYIHTYIHTQLVVIEEHLAEVPRLGSPASGRGAGRAGHIYIYIYIYAYLLSQRGRESRAFCHILLSVRASHHIQPQFVTFCHIFPRKLTMRNCGTSVTTPIVLTPSGSCQLPGLQHSYPCPFPRGFGFVNGLRCL